MVRKLSISIGEELDAALWLATIKRRESKSRVIDTLLREHPTIQEFIEIVRAEPNRGAVLGSTMIRSGQNRRAKGSKEQAKGKLVAPIP
jgi:hypothetical protein